MLDAIRNYIEYTCGAFQWRNSIKKGGLSRPSPYENCYFPFLVYCRMLVLMSLLAIAGLRAALLVGLVFSSARNPSACGLVSSLLCCKCGSLPIFFFILSYLTFLLPLLYQKTPKTARITRVSAAHTPNPRFRCSALWRGASTAAAALARQTGESPPREWSASR